MSKTLQDFYELPDKEMINRTKVFYMQLDTEIHDPDNEDSEGYSYTDWKLVFVLSWCISWAIAERKGVAAAFSPFVDDDGLEHTQAYAAEIFSYLDMFNIHTPKPVYREFLDWLEWIERELFKQSQEEKMASTTTEESITNWLSEIAEIDKDDDSF